MEIIPAILTSDVKELDDLLRQIRDSKKFDRVQIDFIDGEYATNKTFKPMEVDVVPYTPLKFDAHLMVTENYIIEWSVMAQKFGFDRIIAQLESISRPQDFTSLALDYHSPVAAIRKYLPKLELVVVMAVEPGFGGQHFVEAVKQDIQDLVKLRQERHFAYRICVDGGIEQEHLQMLQDLGVDEVAVGAKRVISW